MFLPIYLLFATSSQLLTCGVLAVLGFVGIFVYKLCKKEREDEGGDMDYSVAVTNSLFREERSDTVSIVHPPKKNYIVLILTLSRTKAERV